MKIERIEIPKSEARAKDGGWIEVLTGELEVIYRRSGPAPSKKRRPKSRAREGRRDSRR